MICVGIGRPWLLSVEELLVVIQSVGDELELTSLLDSEHKWNFSEVSTLVANGEVDPRVIHPQVLLLGLAGEEYFASLNEVESGLHSSIVRVLAG